MPIGTYVGGLACTAASCHATIARESHVHESLPAYRVLFFFPGPETRAWSASRFRSLETRSQPQDIVNRCERVIDWGTRFVFLGADPPEAATD